MHSEMNHSKTKEMQFIQMWIMPSQRGLAPSIEQRQYGEDDRRNRLLQILRPEGTEGGGVTVHQDASMYVSHLEPDHSLAHDIRRGHVGYFYLISGVLTLNGASLRSGDAAKLTADGRLELTAHEPSELLLVDTTL
jgi:hypothetical protein